MTLKIRKNCIFQILLLLFLILSEALYSVVPVLRYADEAVTLFFIIYFLIKILSGKRMSKVSKKTLTVVVCLVSIGVLSNIVSHIQTTLWPIFLDIITETKLFICFYGIYEMVDKESSDYIVRKFDVLAKIFLLISFVFCVLSIFYDTGMRGQARYGIYAYRFIYDGAHIFSMMVLTAVVIIVYSNSFQKSFFYIGIAAIQMLMTTKGPSVIWAVVIFPLIHYVKKYDKLTIRDIIKIVVAGFLLGSYQISNYLTNDTAPRFILYKYGYEIAKRFFPIGAGFATYGSNPSVVYYSPLYYEYNIASHWGMSEDNALFLNDNYWPMIIGQFGFLGLILIIYLFFLMFKIVQSSHIERTKKAILISTIVYMLIHSIGSSTPSTSAAVIMMMFCALALKANTTDDRMGKLIKEKQ